MVREESHDIQLALVAGHCYIIVVCLCYVFITGSKPYSYVIGCAPFVYLVLFEIMV